MIENLTNHHKYIGQSIRIEQRWKDHIREAQNKRRNQHLYNALRKYGLKNFHFSIIEECSIDLLNSREQYWIKYYDSMNHGYNETSGGNQNVQFSKKHKENLMIARRKNKEKMSAITRKCWENKEYKAKVLKNREQAQQNSKPVIIYFNQKQIKEFQSIWQCVKWLIDNSYGTDFDLVRSNVRKHLKRNSKTFMGVDLQIRYKNI